MNILDAPCVFCGYCSAGYYQTETHDRSCPWYSVGGLAEREAKVRGLVNAALADRDTALARITELEAEREQFRARDARADVALRQSGSRIAELEAQLAEVQRQAKAYRDDCIAQIDIVEKAESEARRLLHIIKQAATSLTEWDEEYNDDCSTPAPIQFAMDRLQAALTEAPESEGKE